ncbi:DUF4230 domain-containing protein [Algoriphagus aestuariicola]|uniref:DUF4230 domain-containing protein n=1 Tax=Algoriphagus aestuariicola TaxID=1852016 RepID=A0ABS3BYA9_9BACT|nr:DUF4230 domain-containing protein [Algoriphagus aestuariicola]MBN7803325.1 DUF4230 domain-containing protein [Algoriphagus aestuariicola]
MNRFALGFVAALLVLGGVWFFVDKKEDKEEIKADSALIQQQILNVGKLIVTEGYYSQVFTFKNSQNLFMNLFSSDKKALVVVNAKATVEYDLRKLETEVDEANKMVILKTIPEPVVNVYPEIEYYDVTQDYFNKFEAKDYNKIKTSVTSRIREKIEASGLKDDARERLMSELLNIYVLTKSMGWTLQYNENVIESPEQMQELKR